MLSHGRMAERRANSVEMCVLVLTVWVVIVCSSWCVLVRVFNKVAPYRSRCALHAWCRYFTRSATSGSALVAERPSRYTQRRAGAAARAPGPGRALYANRQRAARVRVSWRGPRP